MKPPCGWPPPVWAWSLPRCATPLRIGLIKPMAYFSIENPITTRSRGVYYSKYFPLSEAAKCFIQVFNDVFDREAIIRPPVCQLLFAPEIA